MTGKIIKLYPNGSVLIEGDDKKLRFCNHEEFSYFSKLTLVKGQDNRENMLPWLGRRVKFQINETATCLQDPA